MQGCKSPGVWMPILEFRAHPNSPVTEASLSLPICQHHKEIMTPDDLLSDEGFEQVCKAMNLAGRLRPDREHTTLRWHKP